jgi:hypothetical protein
MKLDTLIDYLTNALSAYTKGKSFPLNPDAVEDIIWFLRLLRKREGYNVERPVRAERARPQPEIDPAYFEELLRKAESWRDVFEELSSSHTEYWKNQYRQQRSAYEEAFQRPPPPQSGKRPWYEVFGVSPNASRRQIQKAYRTLAMKYHPDREGGSHEKMSELNEAKKDAGI